jgi:hypothetical protein
MDTDDHQKKVLEETASPIKQRQPRNSLFQSLDLKNFASALTQHQTDGSQRHLAEAKKKSQFKKSTTIISSTNPQRSNSSNSSFSQYSSKSSLPSEDGGDPLKAPGQDPKFLAAEIEEITKIDEIISAAIASEFPKNQKILQKDFPKLNLDQNLHKKISKKHSRVILGPGVGNGAIYFSNGMVKYVGGIENGERSGFGVSYFKSSAGLDYAELNSEKFEPTEQFRGFWKGDKKEGLGVVYGRDGGLVEKGWYKDDYKHGLGVYCLPDNLVLKAFFFQDDPHGFGRVYYSDKIQEKIIYEGGFKRS